MQKIHYSLILKELDLLPAWLRCNKLLSHEASVEMSSRSYKSLDITRMRNDIGGFEKICGQETCALDINKLQQIVASCTECSISRQRKKTVCSTKNTHEKWLFLGEASDQNEDVSNQPFVGMAGMLLNNMLFSLNMTRVRDACLTNLMQSSSFEKQSFSSEEVMSCHVYLQKQIEMIKPRIIVALGRYASKVLLGSQENVAQLRLREHFYMQIPVVVTYHPAYLLKNLHVKMQAWEDLLYAQEILSKYEK